MARVLLGDFGAIVRLGFRELLEEGATGLVAEEVACADIVDRLVSSLPDVVLLDLDTPGTHALARRIACEFPAVGVIACSSQRPEMRIYPRFHHGESYASRLSQSLLIEAIRNKGL